MLNAFNEFIKKENLFSSADRLLVAVSGGLDSAVLCDLLASSGFNFTIAHCNFRLRGEESERDERFVRELGTRYGKEVLVRVFDTTAYAEEHKLSIQVAARQLRYGWFHEVLTGWRNTPNTHSYILTAHHLDDNIETQLMNLFKGTGITGLRGMLPCQGAVVRPLLFAGRAELEQFAIAEGLAWVEDSSNTSDKYTRNYFRHQVIPLIEKVYPGARQNLADNLGRFREVEMIYRQAIDERLKRLVEHRGNEVFVPVLKLKKAAPLTTLVYEMITPFGFSAQQAGAVVALLDSASGKYVCSATHRVLRNRDWLIISPLQTMEAANILVEEGDTTVEYDGGELIFSMVAAPPSQEYLKNALATVAWLDAADIHYPLLLRKWKQGDYFYPLGMRKKKKLARFFIDSKLSVAAKEKIWVLEMNKKIIWVVGRRIDDRFRIGAGTRQALKIEWHPAG